MIAQHGDSALAEADKVIRDAQQSDTTAERYEKALKKGVFLSE